VTESESYWEYSTHNCGPCVECGQSPCDCSGALFLSSG
jgi:hypothetical protein